MDQLVNIYKSMPWLGRRSIRLVDQSCEMVLFETLRSLGFELYILEGEQMKTEQDFFCIAKTTFGFPDNFGNTWDDFYRFFGDHVLEREGYFAILWRDTHLVLQENPELLLFADFVLRESIVAANAISAAYYDDAIKFFRFREYNEGDRVFFSEKYLDEETIREYQKHFLQIELFLLGHGKGFERRP